MRLGNQVNSEKMPLKELQSNSNKPLFTACTLSIITETSLSISQLSAAKSSLLGSIQRKTERFQTLSRRSRQEPAVIMHENVRQDM